MMIMVESSLKLSIRDALSIVSTQFSDVEIVYVEPRDIKPAVNRILPEILILDAGTSWFENIIKPIRRFRRLNSVYILVITSDNDRISRIVDLGADNAHHLQPGIDDVLAARLTGLINRFKTLPLMKPLSVNAGVITIYPEYSTVIHNGQVKLLTPMEFKLLMLLAKNHMMTVSSDQLVKALWDDYAEITGLRMLVHRLRIILGDKRPYMLIKSLNGGYRLTS